MEANKIKYILTHSSLASEVDISDFVVNFDQHNVELSREQEIHGIFLNFNATLNLVGYAKELVNSIYNTYGIETEVFINVSHVDKLYVYRELFKGKLNLSKLKKNWIVNDYPDSTLVESTPLTLDVLVDPEGPQINFFNRLETPVQLGQTLSLGGNINSDLTNASYPRPTEKKAILQLSGYVDQNWTNKASSFTTVLGEIQQSELDVFRSEGETFEADATTSTKPVMQFRDSGVFKSVSFRIKGNLSIANTAAENLTQIDMFLVSESQSILETVFSLTSIADPVNHNFDESYTYTDFSFRTDEKVWVVIQHQCSSPDDNPFPVTLSMDSESLIEVSRDITQTLETDMSFRMLYHSKVLQAESKKKLTGYNFAWLTAPEVYTTIFGEQLQNELNAFNIEYNRFEDFDLDFIAEQIRIDEGGLYKELTIRAKGSLIIPDTSAYSIDLIEMAIESSSGSINDVIFTLNPPAASVNQAFNFTQTYTDVEFAANEKVWLYIRYQSSLGSIQAMPVELQVEDISFTSLVRDTTENASRANTWMIYEAIENILQTITDQTNVLQSNYFGRTDSEPATYAADGAGAFRALTNGYHLRNILNKKRPTFSFKELYRELDAIECLGLGIVKTGETFKVEIETREDFYLDEVLTTYSNISSQDGRINIEVGEDLYYNLVKVGYAKFEDEGLNSLDEFNTNQVRANHFKVIQREYLAVCESLVASGYALEITRRQQFEEKPTTGTEWDESNFIIVTKRDDTEKMLPEKNEAFSSVYNVISPETSYNLRISPFRMFAKHSVWLNACMAKYKLQKWRFMSGAVNTEMQSTQTTGAANELLNQAVTENEDIEAVGLFESWFKAEYLTFTAPFDPQLWERLLQDRNRYKKIEVSDRNSNYFTGWIMSAKVNMQALTISYKLKIAGFTFS